MEGGKRKWGTFFGDESENTFLGFDFSFPPVSIRPLRGQRRQRIIVNGELTLGKAFRGRALLIKTTPRCRSVRALIRRAFEVLELAQLSRRSYWWWSNHLPMMDRWSLTRHTWMLLLLHVHLFYCSRAGKHPQFLFVHIKRKLTFPNVIVFKLTRKMR